MLTQLSIGGTSIAMLNYTINQLRAHPYIRNINVCSITPIPLPTHAPP